MSDNELDVEYPHWKDALFGNHNAVANIRCAVHYVFWHGVYALIGLVGVLFVGLLKIGMILSPVFGPLGKPIESALSRVYHGLEAVANHRYTELVAGAALVVVFVAAVVATITFFILALLNQFWMVVQSMVIAVGLFIMAGALLYAIELLSGPTKSVATSVAVNARETGEKATEAPGVRRVYGKCPVSMDQTPKWFDKIFPEDL